MFERHCGLDNQLAALISRQNILIIQLTLPQTKLSYNHGAKSLSGDLCWMLHRRS